MKIGNDQNYTFGKYCGRRTGQTVVVYGNFALVTFHSDFIVNKRGFFFRFKTVLTGLYSCLLSGESVMLSKREKENNYITELVLCQWY